MLCLILRFVSTQILNLSINKIFQKVCFTGGKMTAITILQFSPAPAYFAVAGWNHPYAIMFVCTNMHQLECVHPHKPTLSMNIHINMDAIIFVSTNMHTHEPTISMNTCTHKIIYTQNKTPLHKHTFPLFLYLSLLS